MWVLGTELGPSGRTACSVNHWVLPQLCAHLSLFPILYLWEATESDVTLAVGSIFCRLLNILHEKANTLRWRNWIMLSSCLVHVVIRYCLHLCLLPFQSFILLSVSSGYLQWKMWCAVIQLIVKKKSNTKAPEIYISLKIIFHTFLASFHLISLGIFALLHKGYFVA